jgi:hypothetical protein
MVCVLSFHFMNHQKNWKITMAACGSRPLAGPMKLVTTANRNMRKNRTVMSVHSYKQILPPGTFLPCKAHTQARQVGGAVRQRA